MRILIYAVNFAPELIGIGKYTTEMAEWLAKNGENVRVITAQPYYPQWKIFNGYSALKYQHEKKPGIEIFRCPIWVPSQMNFAKRIVHWASFIISSLPIMLRSIFWKPDVVFTIIPPLACALTGIMIARLSGSKAWLHVQDFEIDIAVSLKKIRSHRLRKVALLVEKFIYKKFDRISTISDNMYEYLGEKGVQISKRELFKNWVNTNHIYLIKTDNPLRKQLGISQNTFVVLYSGNIGEKQDIEILIKAADNLSHVNNILFIFCGEGIANKLLRNKVMGKKNIAFLPLQPYEQLNKLLNLADVHIIPQKAGISRFLFPSKLAGMLASERPIIAITDDNSQLAKIVKSYGKVVHPGDTNNLIRAILDVQNHPQEYKVMGSNGRRFVETNFNKTIILNKFHEKLLEFMN